MKLIEDEVFLQPNNRKKGQKGFSFRPRIREKKDNFFVWLITLFLAKMVLAKTTTITIISINKENSQMVRLSAISSVVSCLWVIVLVFWLKEIKIVGKTIAPSSCPSPKPTSDKNPPKRHNNRVEDMLMIINYVNTINWNAIANHANTWPKLNSVVLQTTKPKKKQEKRRER